MYVYLFIYNHIYIHNYTCCVIYINIHIYVCMYMYVCIYIFIYLFTSETSSSIYLGISQPCLMVSEACLWRRHGPDSAVTCEWFCGPGWLYFKHFSGVIPWIVRYCEILLVYPMIFILFTSMGYKPCTVARVCPAP